MHFHIGAVRVEISFLFCILLSCLVLFDRSVFFGAFMMVCVHESAHLFAMLLCGVSVEEVVLEPFGILIKKEHKQLRFWQDLLIICAGCFANIILAALFVFLYGYVQKRSRYLQFFCINIGLAFLNILPITGLDGGQAFTAILCRFQGEKTAVDKGKTVSVICCILLFIFGMVICFKVRLNPSLCLFSLFLLMRTFTERAQIN